MLSFGAHDRQFDKLLVGGSKHIRGELIIETIIFIEAAVLLRGRFLAL